MGGKRGLAAIASDRKYDSGLKIDGAPQPDVERKLTYDGTVSLRGRGKP
jgi:hypothetical protein